MTNEVLNTLYVQTQGVYLRLEGDTVRIQHEEVTLRNVPLHHLGGLVLFGNVLISPFLLARCAEEGLEVSWFSESGRFFGRLVGPVSGNVLLRQAQYRALDDPQRCLYLSQRFVEGKLKNARLVLQRALRERGETEALVRALSEHDAALRQLPQARTVDEGGASRATLPAPTLPPLATSCSRASFTSMGAANVPRATRLMPFWALCMPCWPPSARQRWKVWG